ncbi:MAG TPA: MBL fold metallo-hydrolase [Chloroflexota bacterium]|jgi:L-ascorbate metabolism protein UlaG (beta-lactamase superfamily)
MDISWLGHACFRLRGRDVAILTDPYGGDDWSYPPLSVPADVVTVSNAHPHHAGLSGVEGQPRVLRGPGEYEIGGALIWGVRTSHRAPENGSSVAKNTAFVIQLEELTVCHLGDLANAPLTAEELTRIKDSDVLLVPVGGHCTINAAQAAEVVAQIEPKIIVPMHYATDETRGRLELDEVSRFCRELGASEVSPRNRLSVTPSGLPSEPTVILLERARQPVGR